MKHSITLLLPLSLLLASCGSAAQFFTQQTFADGIYYKSAPTQVQVLSKEDFQQLAAQNIASQKAAPGDSLVISLPQDQQNNIIINVVDPWYSGFRGGWGFSSMYLWNRYMWHSPWYYNNWYYGFYDPWYYDSWYFGPWGYDYWYSPYYYGYPGYYGWHHHGWHHYGWNAPHVRSNYNGRGVRYDHISGGYLGGREIVRTNRSAQSSSISRVNGGGMSTSGRSVNLRGTTSSTPRIINNNSNNSYNQRQSSTNNNSYRSSSSSSYSRGGSGSFTGGSSRSSSGGGFSGGGGSFSGGGSHSGGGGGSHGGGRR